MSAIWRSPKGWFAIILLAICAAMPAIAALIDEPFYQDVFARTMIWAIAALSLNLILGYGGMVSFGHALYLGIGGYAVGIAAHHEITSAWIQWPIGLAACALAALLFGIISLRTRGLYFIMITMALTQMVYFLAVSIDEYGSDDGLIIYQRSDFGADFYSLDEPLHLYYTIFAVLLLSLFVSWRLMESRFGMVVRGSRSNWQRVEAMGYHTFRYRLVCFVIAGVMCGAAGLLSANMETFISPDVMHWTRSGEMIFMVVLGGMGSLFGPVAGAGAFWLLAEFLPQLLATGIPQVAGLFLSQADAQSVSALGEYLGEHWHLVFGPFLVCVVLFAPRGINGLFDRKSRG